MKNIHLHFNQKDNSLEITYVQPEKVYTFILFGTLSSDSKTFFANPAPLDKSYDLSETEKTIIKEQVIKENCRSGNFEIVFVEL